MASTQSTRFGSRPTARSCALAPRRRRDGSHQLYPRTRIGCATTPESPPGWWPARHTSGGLVDRGRERLDVVARVDRARAARRSCSPVPRWSRRGSSTANGSRTRLCRSERRPLCPYASSKVESSCKVTVPLSRIAPRATLRVIARHSPIRTPTPARPSSPRRRRRRGLARSAGRRGRSGSRRRPRARPPDEH